MWESAYLSKAMMKLWNTILRRLLHNRNSNQLVIFKPFEFHSILAFNTIQNTGFIFFVKLIPKYLIGVEGIGEA